MSKWIVAVIVGGCAVIGAAIGDIFALSEVPRLLLVALGGGIGGAVGGYLLASK